MPFARLLSVPIQGYNHIKDSELRIAGTGTSRPPEKTALGKISRYTVLRVYRLYLPFLRDVYMSPSICRRPKGVGQHTNDAYL